MTTVALVLRKLLILPEIKVLVVEIGNTSENSERWQDDCTLTVNQLSTVRRMALEMYSHVMCNHCHCHSMLTYYITNHRNAVRYIQFSWREECVPQKITGVCHGEIGRRVRKIPDVNCRTSIPHFHRAEKPLRYVPDVFLEGSKCGGWSSTFWWGLFLA